MSAVLILQEVGLHPDSVLARMEKAFEKPSIVHVTGKDTLRSYTQRPLYDQKYLIIFDDIQIFKSNLGYIKLNLMLPVVVCRSKSAVDDVKEECDSKSVPCKIYRNEFSKKDAMDLVRNLASEELSEDFCKKLVNRVGLNPERIISAITVFEQVGYDTRNINRYVDKHIYIDVHDVIESLLGICESRAQIKRAALYMHLNRAWYWSYTRKNLVKEVELLIKIYRDFLDGTVSSSNLHDYSDKEHISRYKILYVRDMLETVGLSELLCLRDFLNNSNILEVCLRLT